MKKVFDFMDADRQEFLRIKHQEAMRFIDPITGKIYAHMVERVNCPVCDVDDSTWVFSKAGFDFVKCRHCGLLHVNPQLTASTQDSIYKQSKTAEHWIKVQQKNKEQSWNADRKYLPALSELASLYPQRGKLLDVGCSIGQFLTLARDAGWSVQGIELNADAAAIARRDYGLSIIEKKIEEAGDIEKLLAQVDALKKDKEAAAGAVATEANALAAADADAPDGARFRVAAGCPACEVLAIGRLNLPHTGVHAASAKLRAPDGNSFTMTLRSNGAKVDEQTLLAAEKSAMKGSGKLTPELRSWAAGSAGGPPRAWCWIWTTAEIPPARREDLLASKSAAAAHEAKTKSALASSAAVRAWLAARSIEQGDQGGPMVRAHLSPVELGELEKLPEVAEIGVDAYPGKREGAPWSVRPFRFRSAIARCIVSCPAWEFTGKARHEGVPGSRLQDS